MTKGLRRYRDEKYPSKELEVYQPNVDLFFKFMHRRHLIWNRRFIKHLPREQWSKDEILKVTKYTNIYRQLDRGSLWAIHMIILPIVNKYKGLGEGLIKDLIFKLIVYRMCCRIETFEKAGLPGYQEFDPVTYRKALIEVSKEHSVMTNAYLTCPAPSGMTKIEALIISMIDCVVKLDAVYSGIIGAKEAKDVFEALRQVRGMGRFFAYEVYCDLCYSKLIPFTTNDYVNVGPGCNEGLRLLFPYVGSSLKRTDLKIHELFEQQDEHFERLGIKFRYMNWLEPVKNKLSLRTIEHSLCEFSKYWLQRHHLGKRRLDYTSWSKHDGFSIADTGIDVMVDECIYNMFDRINNQYRHAKPSPQWKKWLVKADVNSDSYNDSRIQFVLSLR